jgi:quinol monooxygenase YgiN
MNQRLITSVSAVVEPERENELTSGFGELVAGTMPEGLLRAELLRGQNGTWRIQSLWRDRDALMAVRGSGEPPAALELFRRVGADHTHDVFTVEDSYPR